MSTMLLPKLRWTLSKETLKLATKITVVIKACFLSYISNTFICLNQ